MKIVYRKTEKQKSGGERNRNREDGGDEDWLVRLSDV